MTTNPIDPDGMLHSANLCPIYTTLVMGQKAFFGPFPAC